MGGDLVVAAHSFAGIPCGGCRYAVPAAATWARRRTATDTVG